MANPLLIQEPPLQVLPTLAQKLGLNEAIILQQIHYWLNPKHNKNLFDNRLWVWNTYEQWQQQFPFWGEKTIRRAISNLQESGVLDSFVTRDFRKTKYYTINYNRLEVIEKTPTAANQSDESVSVSSMSISQNLASEQIIVSNEDQSRYPFKNNIEKIDVVAERDVEGGMEVASHKNGSPIGFRPSGQNDQIDAPIRADRSGQIDQIDQVIMTSSYIDTETTSEITYHPLPPKVPAIGNIIQRMGLTNPEKKEEDEEEKIKLMIGVWNRIVQTKIHPDQKIFLTPKRNQGLRAVLQSTLMEGPNAWEAYCIKIARTQFLMGENSSGFKVTLDWAINLNNVVKILEGAIYDKAPAKEGCVDRSWEELAMEIRANHTGAFVEPWLRICQVLVGLVKQATFRSWFVNIQLRELTSTMAIFEVDGDFRRDFLNDHYKADLERAIQAVYPSVQQIEIRSSTRKAHP